MTTRRELLVLAAAAAIAPVALAQQLRMPKVEVQSDPEADFAEFGSYAWKDPVSPAERPEVNTSIIWYVERGLEEKGLTKVEPESETVPDLFVRYYVKARSSIQGTPSQSREILPGSAETMTTSTSFDLRKVRAGTLILEMQRVSDNQTVWRAGIDISRIDERRIDAEVQRAVRMLLARYPPKPAQP
ncbi:MAG: DUF4136 domain-containing protein [Acidobacteria bacterium]|jgi:hypothetical protein|nr:DUF4136 domain-containing protein [Acidobacteriota bacterium]